MAKNNRTETWRKYVLSVLSLTVATTLSLGVFTACSDGPEDSDDEDTTVSATDTQLIRNGNFEFYSDKDVEEVIVLMREMQKIATAAMLDAPILW